MLHFCNICSCLRIQKCVIHLIKKYSIFKMLRLCNIHSIQKKIYGINIIYNLEILIFTIVTFMLCTCFNFFISSHFPNTQRTIIININSYNLSLHRFNGPPQRLQPSKPLRCASVISWAETIFSWILCVCLRRPTRGDERRLMFSALINYWAIKLLAAGELSRSCYLLKPKHSICHLTHRLARAD